MNAQRGRPKTVTTEPVSTRLPSEVVEALRKEAAEKEWSLSQLIGKIIKEWTSGRAK